MVMVCNKWDVAAKEGRKRCRVRPRRARALPVSRVCDDGVHVGAHRRRRRRHHPGGDAGGRFVARDFPDLAAQSNAGRGDGRDGSAAGRTGGAEPDVRDAGRQRAAAACDFSPTSNAASRRTTCASSKRDFAKRWGWSALRCGWIFGAPAALGARRVRRACGPGRRQDATTKSSQNALAPNGSRTARARERVRLWNGERRTAFRTPRRVRYISILQ